MLSIRKSADRGAVKHGWLDAKHTFSFGDYFDPAHQSFRSLRVLNEDRIAAGQGFGTHPHRDSMGNGSVIGPGDWQMMSAGTGVQHSEFNPSPTEPIHLLQIWIVPDRKGYEPRYDQKSFADKPAGAWALIASPDGSDGTLGIRQDARILAANVRAGDALRHEFAPGRAGWLQVATGSVAVNGRRLDAGDAAALEGEASLELLGIEGGQVVLFDLA